MSLRDDQLIDHSKPPIQKKALEHAYFRGPYVSRLDGSEHPTRRDLEAHDRKVRTVDYSVCGVLCSQ